MKVTGLFAVAAIAGLLGLAAPAGAVVIQATDAVGSQFTVNFDGNVSETDVPGLTSTAVFTFGGVSGNSYLFSVELTNTSSMGITSRTSVLGFDVSPDLNGATSSGLFDTAVLGGSLPNQFGDIEVCFKDGGGPNCQGGGGGGVATGDPAETFDIALIFADLPDSIELTNFGVRYQSIEGTDLGGSGTGRGTEVPPTEVPEPGMLALLGAGLLMAGGLRRRRAA